MSIKLVYIAGPFRAPTAWGIAENIRNAERVGMAVIAASGERIYPVIPHANTQHSQGLASDQFFLDGTLALMRVCAGVVLVPGWEKSTGSLGEVAEAERLGFAVIECPYTSPTGSVDDRLVLALVLHDRLRDAGLLS